MTLRPAVPLFIRCCAAGFAAALVAAAVAAPAVAQSRPNAGATPSATPTAAAAVAAAPPLTGTAATRGDATRGAALFAAHCAGCHGPTGRGDGPLVDRLPAPPPNLADPQRMAERSPADLWTTITNGRLEANMPPFARLLSDDERWDTVAWVRALSVEHPVRLAVGRAAYAARCAECHGDAEAWAARLAATPAPADGPPGADGLAIRSPAALARAYDAVADHAALAAESLEVRSALALLGSHGSGPLDVAGLVPGGRIAGRVGRGAGVAASAPLSLSLAASAVGLAVDLGPVALGADGSFDVPHLPAGDVRYEPEAWLAGVRHRAAEAVALGVDAPQRTDVAITVYAVEPGPPAEAQGVSTLVKADADRGELAVFEVWQIANDGQTAHVGAAGGPSFALPLPIGARDVTLEDRTTRFDVAAASRSSEGAIEVRLPVPPGGLEIVASYAMPYRGRNAVLDRVLVGGAQRLGLVVADPGVRVASDALSGPTADRFGDVAVERYTGGGLPPGARWTVRLTGLPAAAAVPGSAQDVLGPAPPPLLDASTQRRAAAVLAILAIAAAAAIGVFAPAGRTRRTGAYERAVRAIADLDARNGRGELAPRDYQRRRAALVARAVALRPAARSTQE